MNKLSISSGEAGAAGPAIADEAVLEVAVPQDMATADPEIASEASKRIIPAYLWAADLSIEKAMNEA